MTQLMADLPNVWGQRSREMRFRSKVGCDRCKTKPIRLVWAGSR